MHKSDIVKRMKEYEGVSQNKLTRRMPVVIRIDGKAFRSFTRGFKRPFDDFLIKSMQYTMKYLCENIQGCVLGYHQSDEISLLLIDYQRLESAAWFDNEVQKICSISASMATMAFNKHFSENIYLDVITDDKGNILDENFVPIHHAHIRQVFKAMFDARCFNIPKEEVANYFYWRQMDAIRNSVQMVGQANFPRKKLQNRSCQQIKDMLIKEKNINWSDFATYLQRGSCCIKEKYYVDNTGTEVEKESIAKIEKYCLRKRWIIDKDIPVFKNEGRKYLEKLI